MSSKVYQCKKCNSAWFNEELAKKCEAIHLKPEFYEFTHTPSLEYPSIIECGFNDETRCVYKLVEVKWSERERK